MKTTLGFGGSATMNTSLEEFAIVKDVVIDAPTERTFVVLTDLASFINCTDTPPCEKLRVTK